MDWSDWRAWLQLVGEIPLTVRAFAEDEPGDRIRDPRSYAEQMVDRALRGLTKGRPLVATKDRPLAPGDSFPVDRGRAYGR